MQLEWLQSLSEYRTDALNTFFKFLNYLDTNYFVFTLITIIWFGHSYKWGIRITYLSIFNGLTNYFLKILFHIPRPSALAKGLSLVKLGEYSFPSGAAQYTILLASVLIYYWRNFWAKCIGISYVVLIGFSRLYLGVHYPSDLLGGWLAGLLVFYLFISTYPKIEKSVTTYPFMSWSIATFAAIVLIMTFPDRKILSFLCMFITISLGVYISDKYSLYSKVSKKSLLNYTKTFLVLLGIFLVYFIPYISQISCKYFSEMQLIALTLWISLFASPTLKSIK